MKCNKCGYDDSGSGDMAHVCQRPSFMYGEHPTSFGLFNPKQEPVAWKLVPIEPTREMLEAMDECSIEGYDEHLYAGHASSVYIAAVDVAPTPPQPKEPEQEPVALQDDEIYDAAFSAYCRGEYSRELFRAMWSNYRLTSIGWDRDELKSFARNIAALYTSPPQRKPLMWISSKDKMPPAGERVFWMDEQSNRVGYDTWMGDDFRWTASHWMPIPPIEAAHGIKENT